MPRWLTRWSTRRPVSPSPEAVVPPQTCPARPAWDAATTRLTPPVLLTYGQRVGYRRPGGRRG